MGLGVRHACPTSHGAALPQEPRSACASTSWDQGLWASNTLDGSPHRSHGPWPQGCLVCAALFWKAYLSVACHWNENDVACPQLPTCPQLPAQDSIGALQMRMLCLHPEVTPRAAVLLWPGKRTGLGSHRSLLSGQCPPAAGGAVPCPPSNESGLGDLRRVHRTQGNP